jgi:hypothetical protein
MALAALRNVVSRVAAAWRPANAEESFEIVRRRLFQPLLEPNYVSRDNTRKHFATSTGATTKNFRLSAVRPIMSGSSRRLIRYTRKFSSGCIRIGPGW